MRICTGTVVALVAIGLAVPGWPGHMDAAPFTYQPAGKLVSGSGKGNSTMKDYVPGMRYPIEKAPSFPNSQVWGVGGSKGPKGSQCDKKNYSYPWWDNFCETRSWSMPLCPSGKGHQGQDIRPGTCEFNKWYVVACEDGTITSVGTYSVYQHGKSGTTHRYLHMKMSALKVKKGQYVKKGQRLGFVDNDFGGTSTTLHLHYDRKQYVKNVGSVYVPTYGSLVNSYKKLIGATNPTCDSKACAAKSKCGSWGSCGGFSSTCDTTGTQKRTCTNYACSGGSCKATNKSESKACSRTTDGKQVAGWSSWGSCAAQGPVCAGKGSQARSRKVCKGGKTVSESQKQGCTIAVNGKVVSAWTAWSACGGFEWPCDETGVQARTRKVCKGGKESVETAKQACKTGKDGKLIQPFGTWSACVGVAGPCDTTGSQKRTRLVCKDQATVPDHETRSCPRDPEGDVTEDWGDWGDCKEEDATCDGQGVQRRKRKVCHGAVEETETEQQACAVSCDPGSSGGSASGSSSGGGSSGSSDVLITVDAGNSAGAASGLAGGTRTSSGCDASGRPCAPWWLFAMAPIVVVWRRRRVEAC